MAPRATTRTAPSARALRRATAPAATRSWHASTAPPSSAWAATSSRSMRWRGGCRRSPRGTWSSRWWPRATRIPHHSRDQGVPVKHLTGLRNRAWGGRMVRIWGGGVYQTDAFYDALDEAGILIYVSAAAPFAPSFEEAQRRGCTARPHVHWQPQAAPGVRACGARHPRRGDPVSTTA